MSWFRTVRIGLELALAAGVVGQVSVVQESRDAGDAFGNLSMRMVGPGHTSGRISDFAFDPERTSRFFVAVASGGVWRTENAGTTWTPVFDHQTSYATADVELSPWDSNEIWVGTGENNNQRSVGGGDGVYRSVDGGDSWTHVGLVDSGHIGQIRFHPTDPDTVFVAALGPLWSDGGDRGFYKTSDAGETWEKLLDVDAFTGANEFVINPDNPDEMIVSTYERYRRTWAVINGGPGSRVYKTTDSGETWDVLGKGLPDNVDLGRIAFGWTNKYPQIIYASVVGQDDVGGIYRTENFGESWEKRSDRGTNDSAYYGELTVDPNDSYHLILIDTWAWESFDGGESWAQMDYDHRHSDDHAIWFDPDDSQHIYVGGDGGIYETWDAGKTYRHIQNLPVTQFYRVAVDNSAPFYNICGGTQDNSSLCGPSRTDLNHGIVNSDWEIILGGDGFEPQIDPDDPNIIYTQYQYAGLVRYDRRTTERLSIVPQPSSGETAYNWNWNAPLLISPHNSKRIYFGSQKIFRSDDRGETWTILHDDVSRGVDRNRLKIGDRIWSVDAVRKNYWTSFYGSAISIAESTLQEGLLYVGTDDGMIHVSEDGGETWRPTSRLRSVPEMTYVSKIITSLHDVDTAYAVFDNHKRGDFKPYVMKTADRGRTWSAIAGNLPMRGYVHAIAEDHIDPELLFVGTEYGVFFTQDGGRDWNELTALPTIAARDIEIQRREDDLVIGTFGRGIYVLDDYTPLRTKATQLSAAELTSFPIRDTFLYVEGDLWGPWGGGGKGVLGDNFFKGENPPFGAVISYYLRDGYPSKREVRRKAERAIEAERGDTPYPSWATLRAEDREHPPAIIATIRDDAGNVVRRLTGESGKGRHQMIWDLRYPSTRPIDDLGAGSSGGRFVAPGRYTVQLSKRVNRVETDLGAPQGFGVKSLQISPEEASGSARTELVDFQSRTAELLRMIEGADRTAEEIRTRLASLRLALQSSPDFASNHVATLDRLDDLLYKIDRKLNGDSTISDRFERTPWSLRARINSIIEGHWDSLSPVIGVHRESFEIAQVEMTDLVDELATLDQNVVEFERQANLLNLPWTPGRVLVASSEN